MQIVLELKFSNSVLSGSVESTRFDFLDPHPQKYVDPRAQISTKNCKKKFILSNPESGQLKKARL